MAITKIEFKFCDDTDFVYSVDGGYVSPCNGVRHTHLANAIRAECEASIDASGDDPAECEHLIQKAIKSAK